MINQKENRFVSVKREQKNSVNDFRYLLAAQQSSYVHLARANRFVVKKDRHFTQSTSCKTINRSTGVQAGVAPVYRDFTVKKDRGIHDLTTVKSVLC